MARCDSEDDARYRQISGVLKQFIRTELSRRAEDTTTGTGQAPKLGVTQTAFELPSEPKSIATMADMNNSAQIMEDQVRILLSPDIVRYDVSYLYG